jgi:hypothetical protein
VLVGLFAADIGFVRLDNHVLATKQNFRLRVAEALADAMAHKPRSFVADAKHAMDLHRAHALFARHHQVSSGEPLVQRDMAALVQGADRDAELLAAGVALIDTRTMGFALQAGSLIDDAAVRTDWAIRPQFRFKPCAGRVGVNEFGTGEYRHGWLR